VPLFSKPPELIGKFVHGKIRVSGEHSVDGDMVDGEFVRSHGLHWIIAALIIVGKSFESIVKNYKNTFQVIWPGGQWYFFDCFCK
jgi:hypothetical protein